MLAIENDHCAAEIELPLHPVHATPSMQSYIIDFIGEDEICLRIRCADC